MDESSVVTEPENARIGILVGEDCKNRTWTLQPDLKHSIMLGAYVESFGPRALPEYAESVSLADRLAEVDPKDGKTGQIFFMDYVSGDGSDGR